MTAGTPPRHELLSALEVPLIAAPMAGGPSTPELVAAVSRAGGLGMLAGGYQPAEALGEQIRRVRRALVADLPQTDAPRTGGLPAETPSETPSTTPSTGTAASGAAASGQLEAGLPFGVNLFTPEAHLTDAEALAAFRRRWVETVRELDDELGRTAAAQPFPVRTDDEWSEKIRLLLEDPVPLVSFTFGLPPETMVRDLHERGTVVVVSVASPEEAVRAARLGPDALVVQGPEAGGHRATLSQDVAPGRMPLTVLLPEVLSALSADGQVLPVIAAGGIVAREQAASLLAAGALAVQVGTLFVVAEEAGTNAAHRQALLEAAAAGRIRTVVTRAFSGRPARALATAYTEAMAAHEITGYPEVNTLSAPVRRAAAATGRAQLVHLWAGTGAAACRERPAAEIVELFRGL